MTRWLVLVLLVWSVWGCGGRGIEEAEARGGEDAAFGIGFSAAGALLAFDLRTGKTLAEGPLSNGRAQALAWDAEASVLYWLGQAEDGSSMELFQCGLSWSAQSISFGSCSHAAWVDGIATLASTRGGVWVFEDGEAGPRWKVLRSGAIAKGVFAPRPASIWQGPAGASSLHLFSAGPSEDTLSLFSARWSASGLEVFRDPVWLGSPQTFPPTARFTPRLGADAQADGTGGLLWDLVDGELAVAEVRGLARGAWRGLCVKPLSRIDAALAFSGAALGLSVIVEADRAWVVGPLPAHAAPLALGLGGRMRSAPAFFSHDIVLIEERAYIATDRGVRLLVAFGGESGPRAFLDERFFGDALRGPLLLIRHGNDTQ